MAARSPPTRRMWRAIHSPLDGKTGPMVSRQQLLAFVLIAVPGPSVASVIGRALAYRRGVLVQESILVTVLQPHGATYLVYLGGLGVSPR